MSRRAADPRSRVADDLRRSIGGLSTAATSRMAEDLPWFRELSAEDRSWVGMILQAGIRGFVDWFEQGGDSGGPAVATSVFGAAPRALAGVITLQQTVDLVKLSIEVVESNVEDIVAAEDAAEVRRAISRYAREVAFATAEVYARAAEVRGAWDARLEALVVDAVLRAETDEAVLSRASALGWKARGTVCVVLGASSRPPDRDRPVRRRTPDRGRRAGWTRCARSRATGWWCCSAASPSRARPRRSSPSCSATVRWWPVRWPTDLAGGAGSARAAVSAYRSAPGWPEAPRPVLAWELLAERALGGDGHARRQLVDDVYLPLLHARGALVETLTAWLDRGSSIEGAARALFVHPNTVRYRLRQVADLTGLTPGQARDAFTLQIALVLGRQSGRD